MRFILRVCCAGTILAMASAAQAVEPLPVNDGNPPAARQLNRLLENALGTRAPSAPSTADPIPQPSGESGFSPAPLPVVSHLSRDDARAELRATAAILRRAQGKPSLAEFRQVVPRLEALHAAIAETDAIPVSQREPLRLQVRTRLFELGDEIVETARREIGIQRRAARAEGENGPRVMEQFSLASLATGGSLAPAEPYPWLGGAAEREAANLIELIRRTIKPEHWDVNGGPGAMYFYAPTYSLVVRASLEVHWAIGGLQGALGPH